jgi:hypothetical protein
MGDVLAEPAIAALETAHRIFGLAFEQTPLPKSTTGVGLRALENLSDRIYEQAVGMLVCLGTGSAAAAETIARTVIEGAFNLQFIVSQNYEHRLFAYFYQYLQEHERKLDEWQRDVNARAGRESERDPVLSAIKDHRQTLRGMVSFVESLIQGLALGKPNELSKHWPNSLFKRCEQIDHSADYLTSYHRLSASSHINAEETIRWLLGYYYSAMDQNSEFRNRLAVETLCYSAMMTRIAVRHYIEATAATCLALNTKIDKDLIRKISSDLVSSIELIASDAGCPKQPARPKD